MKCSKCLISEIAKCFAHNVLPPPKQWGIEQQGNIKYNNREYVSRPFSSELKAKSEYFHQDGEFQMSRPCRHLKTEHMNIIDKH